MGRKNLGAFLILGLALIATLVVWQFAVRSVRLTSQSRFQVDREAFLASTEKRIQAYTNALLHTRALFLASKEVSRDEFRTFVANMNVSQAYPGIQGVGYALAIPAARLRAHEQEVRRQGFPDYRVWPPGNREFYTSIVFLEPFDWRNQRAFGYDMYSEPLRREAMGRARDSGKMAVSGPVTLVQETEVARQAGFLIYVPVYQRGMPVDTVEQRRLALQGFVYSPFRSHDLFDQLRRENAHLNLEFGVITHDGHLLYASPGMNDPAESPNTNSIRLRVADQNWSLVIRSTRALLSPFERAIPWMILFSGLAVSGLFFVTAMGVQEHASRRVAESAAAQRQEFVSIASHELKTPLTALGLQVAMLERLVGEGRVDEEKLRKSLHASSGQVNRLQRLVDDMNDLSRIQTGQLRLAKETFRLDVLVRDVLERFQEQLRSMGHEVDVRAELQPVTGCWDRFRIEQVFVNLLSNAIKYGAGKPIELTVKASGEWAELQVVDHGVGIAPADQERIFRRFERLASGGSVKGLGLGLYIIEQIVSLHHGKIRVRSELSRGSEFTICLPFGKREPDAASPQSRDD